MAKTTHPVSKEARKVAICSELEQRARARQTITYGELAFMTGLVAQGLGRHPDEIREEEAKKHRPDIGCLVVNASTGFPGYIGNSNAERANAIVLRNAVFEAWSAG